MTMNNSVIEGIDALWTPNEKTGFLPQSVPVTPVELATSKYPSLNALGSVAPKLGRMVDKELREFVSSLPREADVDFSLESPELCEAATRGYVNLAAHLIHRPAFAWRRELPPEVARPLWSLSKYVKRPPSLTYASYVLANFTTRVRKRAPARDLEIAQTPSGTADEEWFVAVHLSVESTGGEIVEALCNIDKALDMCDDRLMLQAIEAIESSMIFAGQVMPTVRERLDPIIFLNEIRPLLYGHDQICFQGVEDCPAVTYIGETGAQSGVIRAVDAALGVSHSEAMIGSMNRFLACAPPIHRQFFEQAASLGLRLAGSELSSSIRQARRAALMALATFRRTHLRVVSEYLAPEGQNLVTLGTGGTNFKVWLQRLIDDAETAASEA
jgi:indoleamine 2,3-dioxygenase